MFLHLVIGGITAMLALSQARPATAQQEGPAPGVAGAFLLDGWQTADGRLMTALQIDLLPGWKTYWRAPGDAGIPAVFDWRDAANLGAAVALWPRPGVFDLNGLQTLGYAGTLILPLQLQPLDPSLPVRLTGTVELGVCENICVPVILQLDGLIGPGGSPDPAIQAALARVPRPAGAAGLVRHSCTTVPIADGVRLTATMVMPPLGPDEVVAIELASGPMWVSQPDVLRSGDTLTASADLVPPDGRPFDIDRSAVRLTVITETDAVEVAGCPAG